VDAALTRLRQDRTLDDDRVARAAARLEASVRGRGPARVRQRLQALGLDADTVQQAVADAFKNVDEEALLDAALARRLRGKDLETLDARARARLIRALVSQGFALSAILKRVRA
jgi:SOS response regulatory protein OraA/RecX